MSQQTGVLDITFKAAADLRLKQYYIVYMSAADSVNAATTATTKAIGVLQNKPQTAEAAVVRVLGTTKVKAQDTAIVFGDLICPYTDGRADEVDADLEYCIGQALESVAAENDIIEMLLCHFTANYS